MAHLRHVATPCGPDGTADLVTDILDIENLGDQIAL